MQICLIWSSEVNVTSFEPSLPVVIPHNQQRESKLLQWETISLVAIGDGITQAKEEQKYHFIFI